MRPLLERIAEDAILRDTKLIAEAWDAAGAYQVGAFSLRRWAEWNGRFRDDVRRFWRGDAGMTGAFASRICGSSDLYAGSGKGPECSINFVACHDGFTLNDLVSYERKHNEANGESNRDGSDDNCSANYGVEGASDDPAVEAVRRSQIKNFLLTLAISRGVPMLLGGDEFRRTQRGNNNAYCQDNATSWLDWSLCRQHEDILRFSRNMFAFRGAHPVLRQESFYTASDIQWFDPSGRSPDWPDPRSAERGVPAPRRGWSRPLPDIQCGSRTEGFCVASATSRRRLASGDRYRPDSRRTIAAMPERRRRRPSQASYPLQSRSSAILVVR